MESDNSYISPDENILNKVNVISTDLSAANEGLESWYTIDGKQFFFNYRNINTIPSGLYKMILTQANGFGVETMNYKSDEYYPLPSLPHLEIIQDVKNFWNNKGVYEKYKITPKRGVILHGDPGCGKTSLIYLLINEIVKYNGLAIYFESPQTWVETAKLIRKLEKDRPLLCIIEDLDGAINKFGEEVFLNFLDGLNAVTNIIYVATTNNLKSIPDRIKNRPSRFDKLYEIKKPSKEDRTVFFNAILHEDDKTIYNLEKLVNDTDKFSMAHLKETFISLYILKNDYTATINTLKNSKISDNPIGFSGNPNS